MANGQVITGFSKPYVAKYTVNDGTVTYTSGMPMARGVSVSLNIETGDTEDFYADNVMAESAGGTFTGGSVTFTVDGLKTAARTLIMGLPTATSVTVGSETVEVQDFDDRQVMPYLGVGFVVRVMENGVASYIPYVLSKVIFNEEGLEANTQEENIEFQTSELEATLLRDDSENHVWRRIGAAQTTEALAVAVVQALLGA